MSTEEVKGESEGRMVIGARRRQASKGGTRSDNVIAANFGCFNCRVKQQIPQPIDVLNAKKWDTLLNNIDGNNNLQNVEESTIMENAIKMLKWKATIVVAMIMLHMLGVQYKYRLKWSRDTKL